MSGMEIRPLQGRTELEACVQLQEKVWGRDFSDRVPASMLMVALETGGVVSGAFERGKMIGFVFGITGLREGRPVHWSDMLAVDSGYRGRGVGRRLKLHQRELLLEAGIELVLWTFDPLEAANAYLNLNRLGAVARTYRRDLYGASASPLHSGIGTDRLVAEWPIASARVERRIARAGEDTGNAPAATPREPGPVINPSLSADAELARADAPPQALPRPGATVREPTGSSVRVAIPSALQTLKAGAPELAADWRQNVRTALEWCFAAGYTAVDLERGASLSLYVLTRSFEA